VKLFNKIFSGLLRIGLTIVCRIDSKDLDQVPKIGPLIIYSNHTGSIEVPVMFVMLQPRTISGLAKIETWNNVFLAWLFNLWGAIPIRRGEADLAAMKKSLEFLKAGNILGISPEGTRNRNGILRKAHSGVVSLAIHSGAPLLPIAHWGGENFTQNLKRFKRTDFNIRVGKPFSIQFNGEKLDKKLRSEIVEEMMYQLALLMPSEYRGEYADISKSRTDHLNFTYHV
jgi:1-acyl-sn-glycerol-3-phosphate acyltransferase